jgi:zinc/manganese transport system substrate-binding protein
VLVVADLLHKRTGDNPHFWYDPEAVRRVIDQITADYGALDRADLGSYEGLHNSVTESLSPYYRLIDSIRSHSAGAPVAATESIFVYMAGALGLNLVTPPEFMRAISEGNDPPASSVATFEQQLGSGQLRLLVYNSQTVTGVTRTITSTAQRHAVPLVAISETIEPATLTFQQWQVDQLQAIQKALAAK